MKPVFLFLLLLVLYSPALTYGQTNEEIKPIISAKRIKPVIITDKRKIQIKKTLVIKPINIKKTLKPTQYSAKEEPRLSDSFRQWMYRKDIEKIKLEKKRALQKDDENGPAPSAAFEINSLSTVVPPDNTVAISDKGFIVSADNGQIGFYKQDGSVINDFLYVDFFSMLNVTQFADPKVIYDPDNERFIFFVQSGKKASESQCILAFSQSEDPSQDWNVYMFNDFKDGDAVWFDYPSLAVNSKEVFLTGNLYTNDRNFKGNVVFQFDKDDGYAGEGMNGMFWRDLVANWNFTPAPSLFAVPSGHGGLYGPGVYLISTQSAGGNEIFLFDITDDLNDDPELRKYTVNVARYEKSGSAAQKNTDIRLDAGDCRIKSGFYMRGRIYFVFSKDDGHGFSGISFNRIRISGLQVKSKFFHDNQNSDYTYPCIAHRGVDRDDRRTVLVYLRSGPDHFPSLRKRLLKANMRAAGGSTTIQSGSTFVDYGGSNQVATTVNIRGINIPVPQSERWGDYISSQRRFINREVWVAGQTASPSGVWRCHLVKLEF